MSRRGIDIPLLCERDNGGCCGCIVFVLLILFILSMCGGIIHW